MPSIKSSQKICTPNRIMLRIPIRSKGYNEFDKRNTTFRGFNPGHSSNDLRFDENLFLLAPARNEIKPANVVVFELVLANNSKVKEDIVVAWGAFPLVNSEFELNNGKFKVL